MASDWADSGRCSHLALLSENEDEKARAYERYIAAVSWSKQRSQYAMHPRPTKRRRIASPSCGTCEKTLSRPFVCLHCPFTACWQEGHMRQHLLHSGHAFCVDAKTGIVFCRECGDFIYDTALKDMYSATVLSVEEKHTLFQFAKKAREPFKAWMPDEKDTAAFAEATHAPCQGRRGFLNLGQTCFLNVILQSFVANPLLRNYFLSDKHNHKLCKTKDCTCCEMDKLFAEVFSGNTSPFGPTGILATTWRASSDLSGYAQQDAHEFFISVLNQIHATSRGSTILQCMCIVHSTFAGTLQSDVKCERCGNVTTTTDPMLDISLELKGKVGEAQERELTLASCLRRYTQPERLGLNEYSCSKCGKSAHESSKRLSIRKLPPVLSFQFKRFEHKSGDSSAARKIEARVRFPSSINMAPFTTLVMDAKAKEAKEDGTASTPPFSHLGPDAMYDYDLFSVVCHEGQIDNGHYTCFARSHDEWYRFDDDKVTPSSLGACLNSQAYMCFYVKKHLDYKPYMLPSYKITREAEAIKEKEREREKEAARIKEFEEALLATV